MSTNTHSEHIIVIAFPLQQWLQEGYSVLRYKYIVYLFLFIKEYLSLLIACKIHYDVLVYK